MDALQILEDRDLTCLIHIKRTHLDKWATHGDFKIKVLHNPDGFQMFHTLETDDKNMELKDTWFPGDILSNIKGIQIETSICKYRGKQVLNVFFDQPCPVIEDVKDMKEEITKDVETEPEMARFHIKDWDKIIDPDSSVKEYPLFVRDEHSNDHWIFNCDVLSKALCRKDVIADVSDIIENPSILYDMFLKVNGLNYGFNELKKESCFIWNWKHPNFLHLILCPSNGSTHRFSLSGSIRTCDELLNITPVYFMPEEMIETYYLNRTFVKFVEIWREQLFRFIHHINLGSLIKTKREFLIYCPYISYDEFMRLYRKYNEENKEENENEKDSNIV